MALVVVRMYVTLDIGEIQPSLPFRFESVPRVAAGSRLSASSLIIRAPLNPFSASIWQSAPFFDI